MTAQESLTAALTGLLNNGDAPPCRANKATLNRWTSDDPDERQWAEKWQEPRLSAKLIGVRVGKRRGITEQRNQQSRWWIGIGLRADDDADDDAAADDDDGDEPVRKAEIALTRESVTCVTSSQSIPRKTIVGNHREHLTQVTQPTPATPVDQTVAEATPCRLHRDRPHPDACFTCAELAGQGWDA